MPKKARRATAPKKAKRKARSRQPKKTATRQAKSSKKSRQQLPEGFLEHRWKPGQSGNPGGRPKGPSITTLRQRDFMRPCSEVPYAADACTQVGLDPETATLGDLAAAMANMHGLMGNAFYYRENLNRDEGKVPDVVIGESNLGALMDHLDDENLAKLADQLPNGAKGKAKK